MGEVLEHVDTPGELLNKINQILNFLQEFQFYLFKIIGVFIKNKMVREDGLTSVLRAFKKNEIKNIKEVKTTDYNLLIIPGGVKAMEKVRQNFDIINFINCNYINL